MSQPALGWALNPKTTDLIKQRRREGPRGDEAEAE